MIRRMFTFASALSLLLCVGAAVLWVRSYFIWDSIDDAHSRWSIVVHSDWGDVLVHASATTHSERLGRRWEYESTKAGRAVTGQFIGFGRPLVSIEDHDGKVTGHQPVYCFPHWAVVVAFGLMPAIVIARRGRQRRKSRGGACRTCGYDLRASSGRCPECGTPIPAAGTTME
jgi:hypothetical protein